MFTHTFAGIRQDAVEFRRDWPSYWPTLFFAPALFGSCALSIWLG